MIDRRVFLLAAGASLAAPAAAASTLLDRARTAAGGVRRLAAVRRLRWTGRAVVHEGRRDIAIAVETEVVPFRSARSRSWPVEQGEDAARTMEISAEGGWVERAGTRTPLPPAMVAHERQQYALYGLMLLCPPARFAAAGAHCLDATHPLAPPTTLCFDREGRLESGGNVVAAAEGGGTVRQRFAFSGVIEGGGIRWPRVLAISQAGRPYFELELTRFTAA